MKIEIHTWKINGNFALVIIPENYKIRSVNLIGNPPEIEYNNGIKEEITSYYNKANELIIISTDLKNSLGL